MRKFYSGLLLLAAGVLFAGKLSAQINVTATAGVTVTTPYTTLANAFNAINAGTHRGAISISIASGTTETVQPVLNSSGTGSASYTTVNIKPAIGATPTIQGNIAGAIIKLNGADNVTVDGSNTVGGTTRDLTLLNTNSVASGTTIWFGTPSAADGVNNNVVKNCILSGAGATVSAIVVLSGSGLALGGAGLAPCSNNVLDNNLITAAQNGTFLSGVGIAPFDVGWVLKNNTVSACGVRGILIQGASNFEISNNDVIGVSNASFTNAVVGILAGGNLSGGNVFGNEINNVNAQITNAASYGIQVNTGSTANINIYNNFIVGVRSNNGSTSSAQPELNGYGIAITFPGNGYNIYHNTIVANASQSTGFASGCMFVISTMASTGAINLRNNILLNLQTGSVTNRTGVFCGAGSAVFNIIDNNDYFSTSGSLGNIGSTNRTTIAQMQTFFGGNVNSISMNPTFVSGSDFHLQSILANQPLQGGVAITTPPITTDIDGNTRASVPFMGADEVYIPSLFGFAPPLPSCGNSDLNVTGVNIQDATSSGLVIAGANRPRIYFRNNGGPWFSNAGTLISGTSANSTWDFVVSASAMGGLTAGDVVEYYIIAQNGAGVVSSIPSAGLVASSVNSVTTPPTSPESFTVNSLPTVASLSATPNPTCQGTPITFTAGTAVGAGTLTSYNWSGPMSFSTTTSTNTTTYTPTSTLGTGQYSVTVTYPGDGCTSTSTAATTNITVNAPLSAITGSGTVCVNSSTTLSNPTGGGTWSSSNTGVATVGATSGSVFGVFQGTSTITYKVGACITTTVITVNPLPVGIAGTLAVCEGLTTSLTNATPAPAGTWSSSNPAIASIADNTVGDVTGVVAGTARISYIIPTGCFTTSVLTVNALPSAISGLNNVCEGSNITLGSAPPSGTWSSSTPAVGTVSASSGFVGGVSAGTTTITYTRTNGCIRTHVVTVNTTPTVTSTPAAATVCTGYTIPLTGTPATGTWSSSGVYASVGLTTGIVTGVSANPSGTQITYTLPSGCRTFKTVTVNGTPIISSTVLPICVGGTLSLSSPSTGGTWSSLNPAIADVTAGTGFVSGISAGTTNISYTMPSGCYVTAVATVNALPTPITGGTEVCVGSTVALSSSPSGGTWQPSLASRATVNSSGVVTGVGAGTVNITYTVTYPGSNSCRAILPMTVNALPAAITGSLTACPMTTTTLSSATAGGTWSSSNTVVGSVATATVGVITGVSAGTANITYSAPVTGCFRVAVLTVNPLPAAIGGTLTVCPGTSTTLTNATSGGTWISSNTAVGTIGQTTGIATGITNGNTMISYRLTATGCVSSAELTVNATPAVITGPANVCVGATVALSSADAGGTWSSSVPGIASITAGGAVTGHAAGTTTISYVLGTGCIRTRIMSVNVTPTALTGTFVVCEASSTNLTSTPGGGTWSSSDAGIATVTTASPAVGPSTGVVTGVSAGTTEITYSLGGSSGCIAVAVVSVNPRPLPISGISAVCIASSTDLDNATTGGTWSSGAPSIASVDIATGVVTGMLAGTTNISYILPTGCARTRIATVNALPIPITGGSIVCVGSNLTMGSSPLGGTWSSSTGAATVTSAGVVTGIAAGITNISYILNTGCFRINTVTVNATPAPISGPGTVCAGSTITLTSSLTGTWNTGSIGVATITPTGGVLTGLAAGTTLVSYTSTEGCRAMTVTTVLALPGVISGTPVVCVGGSTTLGSVPAGGTWSSSAPGIVDIVPGTGFMTGISAGTATISVTNIAGCSRTVTASVNPIPAAITGSTPVCVGANITLASTTGGGTWSSATPGTATIHPATGMVTGVAAGTVVMTYRLATTCYTTTVVTVNALPAAITGTSSVCMGFTTVFSTLTTGGTWQSGNTTVANISSTGVISTVAPGTSVITYTSAPGCIATKVVTVQALPVAIGGSLSVCSGGFTTLTNASVPGTWSSSNLTVGTINSGSGAFAGLTAGNTNITYTLATGCFTTAVATVNPLPSTITGSAVLCSGGFSSTLGSATTPGTWSSSNLSVATVGATSGTVVSGNAGTSVISYTGAGGCVATKVVTVLQTPSAITGLTSVCQGSSIALASSPTGGSWSSTVPSVGTITPSTGIMTGVSAGVTTISYTTSNGCARTTAISVSPTATLTSGPAIACVGQSTTLTYDMTGGSWISGSPSIATVGLTTGVVTGILAGNANISYILPSGCRTISVVTVNAQPLANTGVATVCLGNSTTLSNSTAGVVWSTANGAIATVGSSTGIVVGTGVGNTDITATNPVTGCSRSTTVTVNALPGSITGTNSMCVGNNTTLASLPVGGTWSSNNTTVATAGVNTGVITGLSDGTATITYKLATGCVATRVVTVLPQPVAITGGNLVCVDGTTTYFTPTTGGTWSTSNGAIATVSSTGVITGMSPGIANISYVLGTTCFVTKAVTVMPYVSPIVGVGNVCEGSVTSLSTLTPGGTWSSGNTFVATVGLTSGFVTGQAGGTAIITYTAPTGCTDTTIVTVNPMPSAIAGILNVCLGATTTVTSLTAGGTWSTGNPIIATIGTSSGIVTGNSVGTVRITYTLATGCRTTAVVSVTALPASITGYPQVCVGSTTNLATLSTGGTWTSSLETVAIVGTSGIVTGVNAGTSLISYTLPTGCARWVEVTVNPTPNPITGVAEVCLGGTTTLNGTPAGGAFTSSNLSKATIGVTNGIMNGIGVGNSTITYTLTTGCRSFVVATVHPVPGPITGVTNICQGGSTTMSNPVAGGIWSSDFLTVATIEPATGDVTGVSPGIDTIRYTLIGGCSTKITVTVNEAPGPISGDFEICNGETTTLTPPTTGGTWTSSNPAVATIDLSSGLVTSHAAGSTNISYTLGAGCVTMAALVVNPSPSAITGPHEVCVGQSIMLLNSVGGGTWTSNNASVAPVVSTTGEVSGIASGTATIKYQLPGGCVAQFIVTVNAQPAPISGWDSICQGATFTYTSVTTGGIWTSSNPSIAPINLVTGTVSGVGVGVTTISYTLLGTGCYRTKTVSVNVAPAAITGTPFVCVGSTTALSTTTVGGTWSSINTSVAIVGSTTGVVQGLSDDTTTIVYTVPTGCTASVIIAVNPLPDNITGASDLCVGSVSMLASATPFGSWSSSDVSKATVNLTTGAVTGVAAGTATITYTLYATGCYVIKQVTVNGLPPAIGGVQYMCHGTTSFVNNPIPGGSWSSSNTAAVTIDAFGNVTAVGTGTSTITYQLGSACYVTRMITVEPTLNPITGPSSVCEGSTITLVNAYTTGVWSSSSVSTATVGTSGVVTGVNDGVATITYATPLANCYVTSTVTVDPVPEAITGASSVCVGGTTALANLTPSGTWSSSDGTVAAIDAVTGVVTGVSANTVLISYTVGSGCMATLTFTVKPLSNAGTIGGAAEVCVLSTTTLTSTGDAGGTWSSANTAIATVGSSTGVVSGVAIGNTTISYLTANDCGFDTAVFTILVKPLPDAGTLSAGSAGLCINYNTTVTSTVAGGVWTTSNPAIATINAGGVVTSHAAGTVTVSYTITTDCGTDVATIDITVFTMAPHTAIAIHPDTVLCANSQFRNFGAKEGPATGISFAWSAVNAEVYAQSGGNRQNALISFPNPGTAIVRLTTQISSTGCFVTDSFVAQVTADSAFTAEVKYFANEFICTDNTSRSYQWGYDDATTLDSTLIRGAFQQSYYMPTPDFTNRRYWVISEHGGCYQKVYYNAPTGVATVANGGIDIMLFPNPADSRVNIEVKGITRNDEITVKLIDMLGKEISTSALVNGKGSINVANLASGVYSVMFINNGVKVAGRTFVKN